MGTGSEEGWLPGRERTLVGRSETWTKGGTGEGPLRSAVLRPVHLRPENYRSQRAPLPPRLARSPTPPGPNCHPWWARCTLGRVVLRGAGVPPALPLAPAPGSRRPPPWSAESRGDPSALYPSSCECVSLRAGRNEAPTASGQCCTP